MTIFEFFAILYKLGLDDGETYESECWDAEHRLREY